jgi:hypothetical protein
LQIEVRGPENFLEEFRLRLEDELENNAYLKGPKVGSAEVGHVETYIKGGIILSLQVQESDSGEALLHLESEQEIPDMKELWDKAVIKYGHDLIQRLREIAQNPSLIEKELKQS